MSIETELSARLVGRINELEADAISKLPGALRLEPYHQSCGFIEALRQIRDQLIPELIKEIVEEKGS